MSDSEVLTKAAALLGWEWDAEHCAVGGHWRAGNLSRHASDLSGRVGFFRAVEWLSVPDTSWLHRDANWNLSHDRVRGYRLDLFCAIHGEWDWQQGEWHTDPAQAAWRAVIAALGEGG